MKKLITLFIVTILLQACTTSTHLTSSWKQDNAGTKSYDKILVLGVTERQAARSAGENALVEELRKHGINAQPSHAVFPEYRGKKATKEELQGSMAEKGFDGIITITLLDIEEDQHYVPGSTYVEPAYVYRRYPVYYNRGYIYRDWPFYNYYSTMYQTVYEPGYYVSTTKVFIETNLYDVQTGELVWTAQSESVDPNGVQNLANDLAKAVVNGLEEDKVFGSLANK